MLLSTHSRSQYYWLASVVLGLVPWGAYLRPYSFKLFILLGFALALALIATSFLVAVKSPPWVITITLPLTLILCSSAATFLPVVLGVDGAEGVQPINGYTIVFGGIWALFTLIARALLAMWERLTAR